MMKLMRLFVPLCVSAICLPPARPSPRSPGRSSIDPAQTKVEFTLGSLLHTVHGTFQLKRGTLRFDPQSGKASGELVVDATSGESGSPARDKRMHASILESAKYPEITFRPDRVDGKVAAEGKSQVQLHGMFAIHGAEHEILLPVTVDAAPASTASPPLRSALREMGHEEPQHPDAPRQRQSGDHRPNRRSHDVDSQGILGGFEVRGCKSESQLPRCCACVLAACPD